TPATLPRVARRRHTRERTTLKPSSPPDLFGCWYQRCARPQIPSGASRHRPRRPWFHASRLPHHQHAHHWHARSYRSLTDCRRAGRLARLFPNCRRKPADGFLYTFAPERTSTSVQQRRLHLADPAVDQTLVAVHGEVAAIVPVTPAEAALLGLGARGARPARARRHVGVDAGAELAQVDAQAGAVGEGLGH